MVFIDPLEPETTTTEKKQFIDPLEPVASTSAQEPGILSRIGQRLRERGENIYDLTGGNMFQSDKSGTAGEKQLRFIGQQAGALGDILSEGVKSAYKTVVPEQTQQKIGEKFKSILQSEEGRAAMSAFALGKDAWDKFKKSNPNISADIEAALNIGSVVPVGASARPISQGARSLAEGTSKYVKGAGQLIGDVAASSKGVAGIDKAIEGTVKETFEKSIKPSIGQVGKSASTRNLYYKNATDVVKDIVQNKENISLIDKDGLMVKGALPQNLEQLLDVVNQRKSELFNQYDALKKMAGEAGATVDVKPLIKKFDELLKNPTLESTDKTMYRYLIEQVDSLSKIPEGKVSVEDAQKVIATLNAKLKPTSGKVGYNEFGNAYIDGLKATYLRNALDDAIAKEVGQGYQPLKSLYGKYRGIEDDVARRVNVVSGQPKKGIFDLSDVWIGYHAAYASLTGNVASLVSSGLADIAKRRIKALRDPNKAIESMFKNTDSLMQRKSRISPTQSTTETPISINAEAIRKGSVIDAIDKHQELSKSAKINDVKNAQVEGFSNRPKLNRESILKREKELKEELKAIRKQKGELID